MTMNAQVCIAIALAMGLGVTIFGYYGDKIRRKIFKKEWFVIDYEIIDNFISVRMKSNRGKENCQANSNNSNKDWIVSTYRVESDQKDLIIKALKGDQETLKKN